MNNNGVCPHSGINTSRTRIYRKGRSNSSPLISRAVPVIIHTMNERQQHSPISALLRETIRESGVSFSTLERETGVARASIMRFVRGDQFLRLDMADRLAAYFGLSLEKRG